MTPVKIKMSSCIPGELVNVKIISSDKKNLFSSQITEKNKVA